MKAKTRTRHRVWMIVIRGIAASLSFACANDSTGPHTRLIPGVHPAATIIVVPTPISSWPAEGAFLDVVDGDNNATPIGEVGFAPGRVGQAFSFDGTGELEVDHSSDLELADGNASMSIAAWVKPIMPLGVAFGFSAVVNFNYACSEPSIAIHVTDATWPFSPEIDGALFGVRDNGANFFQVGQEGTWRDGAWHHLVGVRDGPADELRLYIDGQLFATGPDLSGTVTPLRNALGQFIVAPQNGGQVVSSPHRIGAVTVPCATKRAFKGLIDEINVWSVALTGEQVDAIYRNDLIGPITSGVVLSESVSPVSTSVVVSAAIDDALTGGSRIHTSSVAVDDGLAQTMSATDGLFDEVTEQVSGVLAAFTAPGVREVCVNGVDAHGNVGAPECMLLAIYDPNGGFVTGGGWIQSPAGAYALEPSLTGRANFGFVSKYQNGASIPTGSTEFQFRAGNLNFRSTAYEWLVVAGARAQYKGTGRINNSGDYGFLLTAIDGQQPGGGGADRFRIKIWDRTTGNVVYDNQAGAGDGADVTTEVQGGSIVIHK